MSAKSKQQNGQLEKAKADNDQPSSLSSSLSNVELIIKKPHSIWEYRPPLTVDKQLKPALKPYRSFNRGNQFSSLSASASASAQPFQSADVTACQHQKSSMDSSQKLHVTLRSERNFSVNESQVEEAVKPLKKTEAKTLLQATTATANQSVQSSFTGKQVEEGEKVEKEEEEMQSFIAPKVADHESLPSRPPSYRFSNFFSFFPQPSKEWHQQQQLFSAAAVYNSLSQQPQNSSSSNSSSPPPSPPPPYVITTTTFTQTPISSTSTPLKPATRSTSRLHHFIKYLLSGSNLYQKKKKVGKKKASKKLPKTAALSLEEDYQVTDRLEKVMKRVTLAATLLIFCAVLVLIARRCIASNDADDADSKRNLFQQQIVAPSSGRLDLSQFDHLRRQVKVNRPRPSTERLQEAASKRKSFSSSSSSSSSDQNRRDLLIAGLDGRVLANGGRGEREGSNSNSGLEKENSGSEFVVVSNSGGNRGRFHSPPRARPFNPPPPPPPRKPFIPFEKPLNRPQLGDNCSDCVQAKYLAHYYLKQCTAVVSRECRNTCTKYFRCPQQKEGSKTTAKPVIKFGEDVNQQQQANLGCQYGGVKYAFGAQIPLLSEPCRFCRCRKRRFYNGTDSSSSSSSSIIGEIDCSPYIECPEMVFGVKASPGCHFTYRHDECCGKQLCPDELPVDDIKVKTVCRYRGKEYKYGEKIYPEEDTCKKCICDEQWNNHDPVGSKSCVQVRCTGYLKEEITRKCTPIYRADGCCPIDYICPPQKKLYDPKDDQLDQTTVGDEIPQSCTLRGKSYSFGQQLYIDRTDTHHGRVCAKCTCQVPPLFTCMADFRCSGQ